MFKSFRQKIQSLSKNKQNILATVFILIDFLIIIFMISFWVRLKKVTPTIVKEKPSEEELLKEAIKNLSAPEEGEKVPHEVIKNLSASKDKKSEEIPEDLLKNLTAPK